MDGLALCLLDRIRARIRNRLNRSVTLLDKTQGALEGFDLEHDTVRLRDDDRSNCGLSNLLLLLRRFLRARRRLRANCKHGGLVVHTEGSEERLQPVGELRLHRLWFCVKDRSDRVEADRKVQRRLGNPMNGNCDLELKGAHSRIDVNDLKAGSNDL